MLEGEGARDAGQEGERGWRHGGWAFWLRYDADAGFEG